MVKVVGQIYLSSNNKFSLYELDDILISLINEIWDAESIKCDLHINKLNLQYCGKPTVEIAFATILNNFSIYNDHKKIERYVKSTFELFLYIIQNFDDNGNDHFELTYIKFSEIIDKDDFKQQNYLLNNENIQTNIWNNCLKSNQETKRFICKDVLSDVKSPPKEIVEKISTRRSIFIVSRIANDD